MKRVIWSILGAIAIVSLSVMAFCALLEVSKILVSMYGNIASIYATIFLFAVVVISIMLYNTVFDDKPLRGGEWW